MFSNKHARWKQCVKNIVKFHHLWGIKKEKRKRKALKISVNIWTIVVQHLQKKYRSVIALWRAVDRWVHLPWKLIVREEMDSECFVLVAVGSNSPTHTHTFTWRRGVHSIQKRDLSFTPTITVRVITVITHTQGRRVGVGRNKALSFFFYLLCQCLAKAELHCFLHASVQVWLNRSAVTMTSPLGRSHLPNRCLLYQKRRCFKNQLRTRSWWEI